MFSQISSTRTETDQAAQESAPDVFRLPPISSLTRDLPGIRRPTSAMNWNGYNALLNSSRSPQTPLYADPGLSYAPSAALTGLPAFDNYSDSDSFSRSSTPGLPSPLLPLSRTSANSSVSFLSNSRRPQTQSSTTSIASRQSNTEDKPLRTKRQYKKKTVPAACAACGATSSPEWRKGPTGLRSLCNACGLQWLKNFPQTTLTEAEGQEQLQALIDMRVRRRQTADDGAEVSFSSSSSGPAYPPFGQQPRFTRPPEVSDMAQAALSLQNLGGPARRQPFSSFAASSLPAFDPYSSYAPQPQSASALPPFRQPMFTSSSQPTSAGLPSSTYRSEALDTDDTRLQRTRTLPTGSSSGMWSLQSKGYQPFRFS